MGMFKTIWLWIKRILFIACMLVTAGFTIFGSVVDDEFVKTAVSIILVGVSVLLAIGNCVLFFMFSEDNSKVTVFGLVGQIALILVLFGFFSCSGALIGMFVVPFAIFIQVGFSGLGKFVGWTTKNFAGKR